MSTSVLALNLSGSFEAGPAVYAGIAGAIAMLAVIYMGRAVGMTTMDLLRSLGTMVAPKAPPATVYAIGFMMHLMMGAMFGLVHVGLLHAIGPSTDQAAIWVGLLLGLGHGVGVTAMMPVMLDMAHPLVRSGDLAKPGVAMTGYGPMTPMGMLLAHAAFGLVVGAVYIAAL